MVDGGEEAAFVVLGGGDGVGGMRKAELVQEVVAGDLVIAKDCPERWLVLVVFVRHILQHWPGRSLHQHPFIRRHRSHFRGRRSRLTFTAGPVRTDDEVTPG